MSPLTIVLLIVWFLINFFVWGAAAFFREDFADCDGYIWVSKNEEITRLVSWFLPVHAIVYEQTCDYINGQGLAILMYLLSLALLPSTVFFGICGLIFAAAMYTWRVFCRAFARKN